LGKQVAMHIAAAFPLALDETGLDQETLERERAIAKEKAAESGKPADIIDKMVEGAVKKFAKENALLSQLFVMDGKTPIADVIAKAGKDAGSS
ncbi:elongation factor Ts, partial [Escherichia marmotae]|nr:elongation factor Ts [Escherichia marmotae]